MRRRWITAALAVGGLGAALVLAACGSASPAASAWAAGIGTAPPTPAAWGRIDVGLARLSVPRSWRLSGGGGCLPGGDDVVHLVGSAPTATCAGGLGHDALWVVAGAVRPVASHRTVHLGSESLEVVDPALGVTLYGFGADGVRAAASVRPSPLVAVLAVRRWPAAPAGWRNVSAGLVRLAVPRPWPVLWLDRRLPGGPTTAPRGASSIYVEGRGRYPLPPGICGAARFPHPLLALGTGPPVFISCPLLLANAVGAASLAPGDGASVTSVGPGWRAREPGWGPSAMTGVAHRRVGGLAVTLHYGDGVEGSSTVEVLVATGRGEDVAVTLGLGATADVAERVLGSLRDAGRFR